MSDFDNGLAHGWKIDPNGIRSFRYVDNRSGNEKLAEMRNAQGELVFGPVGPRAEAVARLEQDDERDFTSTFHR
jgi:hypothetical protein